MFVGIPLHQFAVPLPALPPHMHLFDASRRTARSSARTNPCITARHLWL
jgi:hypothetical protein